MIFASVDVGNYKDAKKKRRNINARRKIYIGEEREQRRIFY